VPVSPSFAALDETHRQIAQMLADLERLPSLLAHPDGEAEAAALRAAGVVARVAGGAVRLDPRTVLPEEEDALVAAVRRVWG